MEFPTNLTLSLREIASLVIQTARTVRDTAASLSTDSALGPVTVTRVVQVIDTMAFANARFDQLKTTPGLQEYIRTEYAEEDWDAAAKFAAMKAALEDLIAWTVTNLPKDGNGTLLERYFDGNNRVQMRSATMPQALRTRLDALVATLQP